MLHHIKSVTYKTVGLRTPMLRRFIELCKGITGTRDICRAVLRRRRTFYLYQKLVQETCTRNLLGKFDASSSQFLAQQQLASQSRCTVIRGQFLWWNRDVLDWVQGSCTRKQASTRLTDTRASFLYKTTYTSFWYKFLERVSPALHAYL